MRSASEVEQNIVSVERILHYIRLDPEAPYELPEHKPAEDWPKEGGIEFRFVCSSILPSFTIDTYLSSEEGIR